MTTDNSFSTTFTGTLTITFDPSSNVTSTFAVKLSEIVAVDGVSMTSAAVSYTHLRAHETL
ncbi:hypothetical protein NMF41_20820, partial [Acinetobacter baumannii]|nr:hypothetical protein [Acinetobacter baumannii]